MAALAVVLAGLLSLTTPFEALEMGNLDWRFLFRGPRGTPSPDIVLVLVEEGAELDYRSPIPREHLAQTIERLSSARLIGLDIILDKPSFDRKGDARLRQALAQNGKVVAVSYLEDGREVRPHPYFGETLLDIGYATLDAGIGMEVVRQARPVWEVEGGRALALAACLYAHYQGLDTAGLRAGAIDQFPDGLELDCSRLINFSGPPNESYRGSEAPLPGGFVVCPSHLVIAGVYPPAFFQDKIVLVGTGLSDAPDRFRTPFFAGAYGNEKMLGVEVHGHFLRMLLKGEYLHPWGSVWAVLLTFVLALVTAGAVFCAGVPRSAGILAALLVGWWVVGFVLFDQADVVAPLMLPSVGLVAAYGLATAYYGLTEGRERRQTRQLFEKYLSPDIIQEFLQDPSYWVLGGKTMGLTVIFADLEGFTPLSEKLAPEELVKLINHYLNEMTAIILDCGGTIDKYEGDLVMAFFGAPLPQPDHAVRACRAALRMQARMVELREHWKGVNLPELRVRIGLHSGAAVVGNMGSDFRFNYTAMGDTVNLASRLEGANKDFGTYTLISEATRDLAGAEFQYRSLGEIQVKGKTEKTSVYELLPTEEG